MTQVTPISIITLPTTASIMTVVFGSHPETAFGPGLSAVARDVHDSNRRV
jgi:hypothetical protein